LLRTISQNQTTFANIAARGHVMLSMNLILCVETINNFSTITNQIVLKKLIKFIKIPIVIILNNVTTLLYKNFTQRLPNGLRGGWPGCPPRLFEAGQPGQQLPRLIR